jgi:hypothetical protein
MFPLSIIYFFFYIQLHRVPILFSIIVHHLLHLIVIFSSLQVCELFIWEDLLMKYIDEMVF